MNMRSTDSPQTAEMLLQLAFEVGRAVVSIVYKTEGVRLSDTCMFACGKNGIYIVLAYEEKRKHMH